MRNLIGYMKAKGSRKHGTLNAIQMTIDKIDAMQDYEGKHGLVKIGDGADGGKTQLQARERGAEPAQFTGDNSWANDYLNKRNAADFWKAIGNINHGQFYPADSDGDYIIDTENKLVYTNGNYYHPMITRIIEINSDDANVLSDVRDFITVHGGNPNADRKTALVLQGVFGPEIISGDSEGVYGSDEWKTRFGKRAFSRVVHAGNIEEVPSSEQGELTSDTQYSLRGDPNAEVGVNINDSTQPFTQQILDGLKTIETRAARILKNGKLKTQLDDWVKVGDRIGIVRTGVGNKKFVVGYATIADRIEYNDYDSFRKDYNRVDENGTHLSHLVGENTDYDWKKPKVGYLFTEVQTIDNPYEVNSYDKGIFAARDINPENQSIRYSLRDDLPNADDIIEKHGDKLARNRAEKAATRLLKDHASDLHAVIAFRKPSMCI